MTVGRTHCYSSRIAVRIGSGSGACTDMTHTTEPISVAKAFPAPGAVPAMTTLLTSNEVASWIRVSPSTLCRWRQRAEGPRVTWLSPTCPRYQAADVERWLARQRA
jgi:hypothetical protein